MNYSEAKKVIKSGDLIAWRGRTFIGRLIRYVTGSDYSHVGIAWWLEDRLMVIEAVEFKGVLIRPLSTRGTFDVVFVSLPNIETFKPFEWLLEQIGRGYSFMDCLRVAMGIKPKKCNGLQCAELARYFYMAWCVECWKEKPGAIVAGCLLNFNGTLERVQRD